MHITTTEREVLIELTHGKNHEQIAESMQKPRRTIEKHIENLSKRYKASFDNPPERVSEIMLVLCAIEQDDISNPYQNTEAKLTIFDGELESLRALALYGMLNIASKYTDKSESTIEAQMKTIYTRNEETFVSLGIERNDYLSTILVAKAIGRI
ncbi:hypothetical protein KBD69_05465 [Candidatus Woesebacteria bacterium]|nr:hypothetical protein [Candidatus Woesebacteria bacterium]